MAASSPTVLDWDDVSVLVRLCMRPSEHDSSSSSEALDKRHKLVNAVLVYLQIWRPGALIDNDVRRSLVQALEDYSRFFANGDIGLTETQSGQIFQKSEDIQKRLLLAVEMAESDGGGTLSQDIKDAIFVIVLLLTLYQPLPSLSS